MGFSFFEPLHVAVGYVTGRVEALLAEEKRVAHFGV
jgi:hypothetical protein